MNKQIDSPFNFLRHSEYHICSWRLSSGTVTFIKNKIKHLPKKCLLLLVFVLLVWSESCSIVSNSLWPHGLSMDFSRPEYWSEYFRILNTETWSLSLLQVISQSRDQSQVSCIAGGFFTSWATREAFVLG